MKEYDFTQIVYHDIEDNEQAIDLSKDIGNKLYFQSHDIAIAELGKRIYQEGSVSLNDKEIAAVKSVAEQYPAILRQAINAMFD